AVARCPGSRPDLAVEHHSNPSAGPAESGARRPRSLALLRQAAERQSRRLVRELPPDRTRAGRCPLAGRRHASAAVTAQRAVAVQRRSWNALSLLGWARITVRPVGADRLAGWER